MKIPALRSDKFYISLGHIFFVFYIGMAAFFFREREFVADNAFHVFVMLQKQGFAIFQERYSIVFAQILPVLGIKLKASLNTVLLLHTVSVPLFCYTCFCLAAHALKNTRTALGIVLGTCIMVTQSFYFLFELNQAISLLILLHGFIQNRGNFQFKHWLLLLVGLVLAFFLHPLVLIGFLYLCGYTLLQQNNFQFWQKNQRLLIIMATGLLIVAVRMVFFSNPYEESKTPALSSLHLMLKVYRLQITPYFIKWLFRDYYLLLVFSACITVHYIRVKQFLRLGWYWVSLAGFMLLLLATHQQGDESIRFYLELHYQILALIAVIPFIYDVWPNWKERRIAEVLMVLLLISRFATFYAYRTVFVDRLLWYDKIYSYTDQFAENKFVVNTQNVPGLKMQNQLLWASAYESLLYFASTGKQSLKTIFISDNVAAIDYLKYDSTKFASTFESFPASNLQKQYFVLESSAYRFLNSLSGPEKEVKAQLEPLSKTIYANSGEIIRVPLRIQAFEAISSGLKPDGSYGNSLSYRLYKNKTEAASHTVVTPLEVDVYNTYTQDLLVEAPEQRGTYFIVADLLPSLRGNAWNKKNRISLIVK